MWKIFTIFSYIFNSPKHFISVPSKLTNKAKVYDSSHLCIAEYNFDSMRDFYAHLLYNNLSFKFPKKKDLSFKCEFVHSSDCNSQAEPFFYPHTLTCLLPPDCPNPLLIWITRDTQYGQLYARLHWCVDTKIFQLFNVY